MTTSSTLRFFIFIFSFLFFSTANSFAAHAAKDHGLIQLVIAPKKVTKKKKTWKEKLGIALLEKRIQKKIKKLLAKEKRSPIATPMRKNKKRRIHLLSIVAIAAVPIGALLSFFFAPMVNTGPLFFALGSGLVAFITGRISLAKIKKNPEQYSGKAWAILGMVLGSLALVSFLLMLGFILSY